MGVDLFLERKHEDSVIDIFRKRAEKLARNGKKRFMSSPLDGQDRELGADLFVTASTKFLIVEFKFQEPQIANEADKPLRLELCKALSTDLVRMKQHIGCHLIAWSTAEDHPDVLLNKYCDEVCNAEIWKESGLAASAPDKHGRIKDVEFIQSVLSAKLGLKYSAFSSYIQWLKKLAGDDNGRFELLMEHPDDDVVEALTFTTLQSLKAWLDNNPPKPKPPKFNR